MIHLMCAAICLLRHIHLSVSYRYDVKIVLLCFEEILIMYSKHEERHRCATTIVVFTGATVLDVDCFVQNCCCCCWPHRRSAKDISCK